jgi:hypothetical protein
MLELGPRNGGCRIPEVVRHWEGVDMIAATVEAALGRPVSLDNKLNRTGFWATYVIHSVNRGRFKRLRISDEASESLIDLDVWSRPGDEVRPFLGSDDSVGSAILRFNSELEMVNRISRMSDLIFVVVE